MGNVALVPQQISLRTGQYRHKTVIIGRIPPEQGTMKIVALDHEKCRYSPLNLGNQERKESYLKKE